MYQKWSFDGITGESLIFDTSDITDTNMAKFENEIKSSPLANDSSSEIILAYQKHGELLGIEGKARYKVVSQWLYQDQALPR